MLASPLPTQQRTCPGAPQKGGRYISRVDGQSLGCVRKLNFEPRKSTPQTPSNRKRKRGIPGAPLKSAPQTPLVKLSKRKCPTAPFKK